MKQDIFSYAAALTDRVQKALSADRGDQTPVQSASQNVRIVKQAIVELKVYCRTYGFTNAEEEIRFFKKTKPVLISQYLYQREVWKALLADAYRDTTQKLTYYVTALSRLQKFAQDNDSFYQYCLSGETYHDEHYFTRRPQAIKSVNQDDNFSTSHDMKLAKVLAFELLREYFVQTIEKLQRHGSADSGLMQWTAPKTAAIELVYALQASGAVNNGKTDIKLVINNFERIFNISLGNFYRSFSEMSIRKGSRTVFLDAIRERLIQKLEERDE